MLLGEAEHERLLRITDGSDLLSSVLPVLESVRNLIRLSREGALTEQQFQNCIQTLNEDMDQFLLRDLSLHLCNTTPMPVVSTPHSLDLVHLRTALWFHHKEKLTHFVTLDNSQKMAARELGLPVWTSTEE